MIDKLQYVQIGGMSKSGTSLMSSLLDGHPEIASFPIETGHTGINFPVLGDPRVAKEEKVSVFSRPLDKGYGHSIQTPFDSRQVKERFLQLAGVLENNIWPLHKAFLQAFYEVFDRKHLLNARLWVDKSPFSHLFADEIFKAFPAAKFIHMVRDPRDNFAAIGVKFVQQHRSRVDFECLVWRYRVWACQSYYCALENQKKFGSDVYKIIRFEDLCLHPEKVIPEISTFLGIAHDECLYRPTIGSTPYPGNNWEGKIFAGISSENVNNWSLRIPEYYACLMECQPGGLLDHFDYKRCFSSLGHLKALSVHKLLTSVIPRQKLLLFHERLFQKPASDMLGV